MDKLRITEETSARLVLEKVNPISVTWKEWQRYLISPLLLLAITSYFYFVAKISLNGFFWVIAIGVFLAEALFISIILTSERKRIVIIDVSSKKATRIEKLIIGLERKKELALEKVSRILIHCEQVSDHCVLELDTQSNHPLVVASNFDLRGLPSESRTNTSLNLNNDEIEIKSLESLGIKISKLLMKPVKSKLTEKGILISEHRIYP